MNNKERIVIASIIVAGLIVILGLILLTPRPAPASKGVQEQAEKFVESSKESRLLESIKHESEHESDK